MTLEDEIGEQYQAEEDHLILNAEAQLDMDAQAAPLGSVLRILHSDMVGGLMALEEGLLVDIHSHMVHDVVVDKEVGPSESNREVARRSLAEGTDNSTSN
jgi:hypothetical protein